MLLGASGICTFIRIQKRNWVEAEKEEERERERARNCGGDDDDVDPFEHHNSSEDCKLCWPREWAEECAAATDQAASSVGFELEKQEQQNGDEEKELTKAAAETIAKEVQRI